MARLPGEQFLIQQMDGVVILFEEGSEREIVRIPLSVPVDPHDPEKGTRLNADGFAKAHKTIHDSELSDEDKCFAHFWCGYFWAHAGGLLEA